LRVGYAKLSRGQTGVARRMALTPQESKIDRARMPQDSVQFSFFFKWRIDETHYRTCLDRVD